MANAQVTVALTKIDKDMLGYQAISLTHFTDGVAPTIAAGSKVEISGALFDVTVDETIGSLAGIANSSQVYFLLTVSGASFTAGGTITAPTYNTAKQGWYTGANRVIGGCYKDSGGNYVGKWLYEGQQQATGIVPIGSIIAWHKSLAGVPGLPGNFVQCDGQILSDSGSPLNGQTIPDLNGTGRFLRGSATSGTVQAQGTKLPSTPFTGTGVASGWGPISLNAGSSTNIVDANISGSTLPVTVTINGGGDAETRPLNMSVVWIMRVK